MNMSNAHLYVCFSGLVARVNCLHLHFEFVLVSIFAIVFPVLPVFVFVSIFVFPVAFAICPHKRKATLILPVCQPYSDEPSFLGSFSKTLIAGWMGLWFPGKHVSRVGGVRQLCHRCFHQRGSQSDRGTGCLSSCATWHPLSFNTIGLGLGPVFGLGQTCQLRGRSTATMPPMFSPERPSKW